MRHLLIDGDVLAYKAAASVEVATEWEPGFWTWHCDEAEVRAAILAEIDTTMEALEAQGFTLCLTDSAGNFRKTLLPTYKANRKNVKRPLVLQSIRAWLIAEHGAVLKPHLEGDDVLGILATWPKFQPRAEKIIVSIDKDMKTIPGLYCRDLESGLVEITETEADTWHLTQTLTGDQTDGYAGCPGIGPKRADAILAGDPSWAAVVAAYEKARLSEAEALVQARVARILRASDWDFKARRPILWTP